MPQITYSPLTKTLTNGSLEVIECLGQFVYATNECSGIIRTIVEKEIDIESLHSIFEKDDDAVYIGALIDDMVRKGILIRSDRAPVNSSIDRIQWLLTENCNLACIHCCSDAKRNTGSEVTFEQAKLVINTITELPNLSAIEITGGEPLLVQNCKEIIEYLRQRFTGHLTLMTNALLINANNIEWIMQSFDKISISIDGSNNELTSMVRGPGVFEKVIHKIKLLKSSGFDDIALSAILPDAYEIQNEFEALCASLNVQPLLRVYSMSGRGEENHDQLQEQYSAYLRKMGYQNTPLVEYETLGGLYRCSAWTSSLTICPNGDLYPCGLLVASQYKLGNIFNSVPLANSLHKCDSSIFMKLKDTPCEMCEISGFCWSCYADFDFFKQSVFDSKRCEIRKRNVAAMLWN